MVVDFLYNNIKCIGSPNHSIRHNRLRIWLVMRNQIGSWLMSVNPFHVAKKCWSCIFSKKDAFWTFYDLRCCSTSECQTQWIHKASIHITFRNLEKSSLHLILLESLLRFLNSFTMASTNLSTFSTLLVIEKYFHHQDHCMTIMHP